MGSTSPFQTCWDRVARAEIHRQALIHVWAGLDTQSVYSSQAKVDPNGDGKFFLRTVQRDWLLPFSLELGEMLYQLRSALDSCVYDAACLEFKQCPPPDEERWNFPIFETPEKFDEGGVRRMKKLPDDMRGLLEAVQLYSGRRCQAYGMTWDIGQALFILNTWAKIDRHRRLNLAGTVFTKGALKFDLPKAGMSIESCDFEVGQHVLENDTEIARFRIRNFISGTKINVNCQFALEIIVNETPPGICKLQDAALTIGASVSAVREGF